MRIALTVLFFFLPFPAIVTEHCAVEESTGLYYCKSGSGGPTIVLEAGMRGTHGLWGQITPHLSGHTTVVRYDRAGNGQSLPASERPRNSAAIADELNSLLAAIEVPAPYILIGHSVGGWHARTFAATWPDKVAALILVDSPHEAFDKERHAWLNPEAREARLQSVQESRADLPEIIRREYKGLAVTRERLARQILPETLRIVVISATDHTLGSEEQQADLQRIWTHGQSRLKALSQNGTLIEVTGGHMLPVTRPEVVVNQALEALSRYRKQ